MCHSSTGTLTLGSILGVQVIFTGCGWGMCLVFSLGSEPPNFRITGKTKIRRWGWIFISVPRLSFGTGWATSGSAAEGDDDIIEVSFGPGSQRHTKFTLVDSNSRPDGTIHKNQDVDDIDGDGNTTEGSGT